MTAFDQACRAAVVQDRLRRVQKKPVDLVPFDEVRAALSLRPAGQTALADVRLDDIVGSCGRQRDFNRQFSPRSATRGRWIRVLELALGSSGFPPVDLFRAGGMYFVHDGHHRVSVARALGAPTIEANVTEFDSPIELRRDDSLREIVLRASHADFVEALSIDGDRADDLLLTDFSGYHRLMDHISVHRYYRGVELKRPVEWNEAFDSWRSHVYDPMAAAIRESGVLGEMPGRTVADVYLSAMDHYEAVDGDRPERRAAAVAKTRDLNGLRRGVPAWLRQMAVALGSGLLEGASHAPPQGQEPGARSQP